MPVFNMLVVLLANLRLLLLVIQCPRIVPSYGGLNGHVGLWLETACAIDSGIQLPV